MAPAERHPAGDADSRTVLDTAATVRSEGAATPPGAGNLPPPPVPDHELLRPIGRGSYGEVWLARNIMGTFRAVKIVYRAWFDREKPFEREFTGIQKFEPLSRSHSALVDVLQIGRTPDCFYYVMELADDAVTGQEIDPARYQPRTLRQEVVERGRVPIERCVEVGLGLASGLQHLHSHGLIHRDIKPSNIIFVHGQPKLADIGLVAEQSEAKSFVGTEGFIPPEGPGTPAADVYSLGKVLYEMATGRDRHEFPELPTLTGTQEEAGLVELNAIVLKACQNEVKLRYASAEELRQDLLLLQSGKSVKRAQVLEKRLRRLLQASAVGIVATLLALGAVYFFRQQAVREGELRARAQASEREARRTVYASDMLLASHALDAGNLGRARELLDKYRGSGPRDDQPVGSLEDVRGWEWRHLSLRAQGDTSQVLKGHTNFIASAFLLGDGKTAVSVGRDRTLRFWDLGSGQAKEILPLNRVPDIAAISPDGRFLADLGRGGWSLWDLPAKQRIRSVTNEVWFKFNGAAFSPDSTLLAVAHLEEIHLVDVGTGAIRRTISRRQGDEWADAFVIGMAFSPDGKTLAYAHARNQIVLHDLASGQEADLGGTSLGEALTLAYRPDGAILASGDRGNIKIWDVASRALVRTLTDHREQVVCVAFSPDGTRLASASGDQTVRVWETETWKPLLTLRGHEEEVHAVAFSPDGRRLISGSNDETVRTWEVERTNRAADLLTLPEDEPIYGVKWHGDKTSLILGGDRQTLSVRDGATLVEVDRRTTPPAFRSAVTGAIAREGSDRVALGMEDGSIEVWRLGGLERETVLRSSDSPATTLRFESTGEFLAVERQDRTGEIWNLQTSNRVAAFPALPAPIDHTALSWGAHRYARVPGTSADASIVIQVHFLPEGRTQQIRSTHRLALVQSTALSGDGKLMATSTWDARVKLWDVETGVELHTFRGQLIGFTSLAFSPDDSRLVAGGFDGTLTVWDVKSRSQVAQWRAHGRMCDGAWFGAGDQVLITLGYAAASGPEMLSTAREIRVWRAPSVTDILAAEGLHRGRLRP